MLKFFSKIFSCYLETFIDNYDYIWYICPTKFSPSYITHILSSRRLHCSFLFLAFDFCRSAWSQFFFIPTTTANDLRLHGFLSQILSITFLSYLNSWERASISLSMLSAKQGSNWYVFGMKIYDVQILTVLCINYWSVNVWREQKASVNKNALVCIY